jgi:hypothetical protein
MTSFSHTTSGPVSVPPRPLSGPKYSQWANTSNPIMYITS